MTEKSDREIKAQARLAINEVLMERRGEAVRRLKPSLKRAFPFGPEATKREKQIWSKFVDETLAELANWPKPVACLLIAFLACSPAFAQATTEVTVPVGPPVARLVSDGHVWYMVTEDGATVTAWKVVKPSFDQAHPRWALAGRIADKVYKYAGGAALVYFAAKRL